MSIDRKLVVRTGGGGSSCSSGRGKRVSDFECCCSVL